MNRRLAKIIFSHKNDLSATTLIQLLGQLPKDAKIINMGEDWTKHCYGVTVESERYKALSECQQIPEIIAKFERIPATRVSSEVVVCKLDDSAVLDSDHALYNHCKDVGYGEYRSAEKQDEMYNASGGTLTLKMLEDVRDKALKFDIIPFEQLYQCEWISKEELLKEYPIYNATVNNVGKIEPRKGYTYTVTSINTTDKNVTFGKVVDTTNTKLTMEDPSVTIKLPPTMTIKNHITPMVEKVAKKKCEHSWQKYEGIMNSYNFCVHCDAKENL